MVPGASAPWGEPEWPPAADAYRGRGGDCLGGWAVAQQGAGSGGRDARQTAGYGLRAVRIGEASNPGPPRKAARTPDSNQRLLWDFRSDRGEGSPSEPAGDQMADGLEADAPAPHGYEDGDVGGTQSHPRRTPP